jgi:hypothetical protein
MDIPNWIESVAYDQADKFMEELQKAYSYGRDKGLQEAWEFANHLYSVGKDVTESIYMSMNGGKGIGVALEMPYADAIKEYEEWQDKAQTREIKSGDIVFNRNNKRNALVLHVIPDNGTAQVAEFNRDFSDGIMVHCPPLAALEKRIDGAVDLLALTANIEKAED